VQRALAHRSIFREALTWLEVHGGAPEIVEHWKAVLAESGETPPEGAVSGLEDQQPGQHRPRRRRRRRRRRFPGPTPH
jgi:hypothetical protein